MLAKALFYLSYVVYFANCNRDRLPPGVNPHTYQAGQGNYPPPPPAPGGGGGYNPQHGQPKVPYQQNIPHQQQPPPPPPPSQQQQQGGHGHGQQQILNAANIQHEKEHMQEHMDVPLDTSKMTDQELQFHYFKMHDSDNNNKLDGCELIKSLIHWHDDNDPKLLSDDYIMESIDSMMQADTDNDGYISYTEYKVAVLAENKKEEEK